MDWAERLTDLLADCHDDPDLFNSAVLGRPAYWTRQRELVESVVKYRITCAFTGNALGKDYAVGGIIPWWASTRADSLTIVTGPSQTLLGSVTWKEVRRAVDNAIIPLGFEVSRGIRCSPLKMSVRGDWGALGFSTTSVERASGQHNRRLLVIVEEASGVPEEIWDAIDGLGYHRLLAIGNPIRPTGRFVDLIHQAEKDRRDGAAPELAVNAIRISSRESPDAGEWTSERGLASRSMIEDAERRYGRDSLWVRSHIDAILPEVGSDQLIPDAWVNRASAVVRGPIAANDPSVRSRRIACDLGEGVGRDSTAICVRDDFGVLEWVAGNALDLASAAREIARLAIKWRVPHERISYDALGVGRDMRHHLAREGILGAIAYKGSARPRDPSGFTNLRTEAAWRLRQRLNPEWCGDPSFPVATQQQPFRLPPDGQFAMLCEELHELSYECVGKQVRLISKEDLCARLGRSPDRSDALLQSFAF